VVDRPVGNRRVYYLDPAAVGLLRDHLDWHWGRALTAFQQAAEERATRQRPARQRAIEEKEAVTELKVVKAVTVAAPLDIAFDVFIDQGGQSRPITSPSRQAGTRVVLEPFTGGRWYEVAVDGSETDWGTVLAWQPPHRLRLTWQIAPGWTYEPDPAQASQIEVTFTADGPELTRVELAHRHLERYGKQAERMRKILDRPNGAAEPLRHYAERVTRCETRSTAETSCGGRGSTCAGTMA
jgi:uncharacterized protein YndB with AHSA1/START domain